MNNKKNIVNNQGNLSTADWMKKAWDDRAKDGELGIIKKFTKSKLTSKEYWKQGENIFELDGTTRYDAIASILGNKDGNRWKLILDNKELKKMKVLDLGCGIGRVLISMSKIFGKVIGVDISPAMLEICKNKTLDISNIELHENNGTDLSMIKDKSVDFCYSYVVFQHIPKKSVIENYLKEIKRVLKDGCIFRFQIRGTKTKTPDSSTSTVIGVSFTQEEIHQLAEKNNFEEENIGGQYYWLTFKS